MGYYATGGGDIEFTKSLTMEEVNQVEKIIKSCCYDVDWNHNDTRKNIAYLYFDDKYRSECLDVLNEITAPIKTGTVYFHGEDGEQWKLVYSAETGWEEISARTIFDDEPFVKDRAEFVGQIIDIFEDFLEKKGIDIPNEDKVQSDDPAIICGMDYGELQSEIEAMMQNWGVLKPEQ